MERVTTAQPAEPEKPEMNSRRASQAAIYLCVLISCGVFMGDASRKDVDVPSPGTTGQELTQKNGYLQMG